MTDQQPDFAILTILAWYSGDRRFWSGAGNRLSCETCGFSFFLTNAVSTSDYSATDSYHTFPNSLIASDLVSEITQLMQWLIYRLDDREIGFRFPIREWNFFLSVAPRSALGYNHTLVQWLRLGSFYPAWKIFTTRRRDCECVELYHHSPIRFMAQCLIKHMLITLSLHTL